VKIRPLLRHAVTTASVLALAGPALLVPGRALDAQSAPARPPAKPAAKAAAVASQGATPPGTTLEFVNAKLADVIRTLAMMLGRTIVASDVPDVKVTFSTPSPLKPGELEGIFESASSRTT
jgi:hypothetical protein